MLFVVAALLLLWVVLLLVSRGRVGEIDLEDYDQEGTDDP